MLTDFQFGLRQANFSGQRRPAIILGLLSVALAIGQDTVRATTAATVKAVGVLRGRIKTELQRPLGIIGGKAQIKALAPTAIARWFSGFRP